MIRVEKFDEFFHKQPPRDFIKLLGSPVHEVCPPSFGKRSQKADEINAQGLYLTGDFPDQDGVLETAYADFQNFLKVYHIDGDRYPLQLVFGETRCFEAYTVNISASGITLRAADTEGIRRGLIYIEDLFTRSESAYLVPGETERWPHIKDRITRGFFSPTNRPPKNGDELSDDIDYYPEEYLNRLAHDGTNGLWIYTSFRAILPPGMIPEYGEGYEKRLNKLRDVIRRCARYGIKVYVFAMEPMGFTSWDMLNKYPQVWGSTTWDGKKCFCTDTDFGRAYCIDSTETMSKLLPGLGGYIAITCGERPTNCTNGNESIIDCPRCSKKGIGEVLSQAIDVVREGMRRAKTDATYISWTYGHRDWAFEDIEEYVRTAPDDVILMQNFDDMGVCDQLGKDRLGADYWLSYAGPSEMFRVTADACKKYGKTLYAKMQVCCSHEIATVPYLPTPGLIFDKFKGAHACGVSGVMECWYFGNYPSLMSKAAGELSFLHDFSDENAFLEDLAAIYWGNSRAKTVAKAWKLFKDGYVQYPLNIMFSYYGPMHDGITWELQLIPKNFSLPRSWFSTDKPDGDRLAESLMCGHTQEEAATLTAEMSRLWKAGMEILDTVPCDGTYTNQEQISVAKAIDILFESGANIVQFYTLRDQMGQGMIDAAETLPKLKAIVEREMELSRAMVPLWENDRRLGYHSEAENYKFFPEKLLYRIERLQKLLETEFPAVAARIADGQIPFPYYLGEEEGIPHYQMHKGSLDGAAWEPLTDHTTKFRIAYDAENLYIEIEGTEKKALMLSPEFRLLHPAPTITIKEDGTVINAWNNKLYYQLCLRNGLQEVLDTWQIKVLPSDGMHYVLTLDRTRIGWTKDTPMKIRFGNAIRAEQNSLWVQEENPVKTLGKVDVAPGEYGWLMP